VSRPRTPRAELRVGLLLLTALAIFTWLSIQVGGFSVLSNKLEVKAVFDDAGGLVEDSAVKVAGVKVGSVRSLSVEFDRAVAVLALDKGAELRQDVRAEIRARSLLGEKYVALMPRSADAPLLKSGDEITNTVSGIEINQLITQFGPLLKKIDPEDMARIVKNLGEVTAGVGEDAPAIMKSLKDLLDNLNDASEMLPEVKAELPQLLTDLRRVSWKIERSLQRTDRMLASAHAAADAVPVTTGKMNAAIDKISPSLDDLNRTLSQSDEALVKLLKVLTKADKFSEEGLRRLLREEGVLVRLTPQRKKD